jgi:folate-binding protein YgfZ
MNDVDAWQLSPAVGWSFVQLLGRDAIKFLNNFCTADLTKIPAGQAGELMLLNAKGHVLAWGAVIRHEEGLQLMLSGLTAEAAIQHLDAYLFSEDVRLDVGACHGWLLQRGGPNVTPALGGSEGPSGALIERPWVAGPLTAGELPWSLWPTFGAAFFVWAPRELTGGQVVAQLADVLTAAGLAAAPQISLQSTDAYQAWRIAHRVPLIGQDTVATSLPQELLRDARAISFTKGCYLGQETVARLDAMGHVNWHLQAVKLEPAWPAEQTREDTAAPNTEVRLVQGQQTVGQLTSVQGQLGLVRIRASVSQDWAKGRIQWLELRPSDSPVSNAPESEHPASEVRESDAGGPRHRIVALG